MQRNGTDLGEERLEIGRAVLGAVLCLHLLLRLAPVAPQLLVSRFVQRILPRRLAEARRPAAEVNERGIVIRKVAAPRSLECGCVVGGQRGDRLTA